MSFDDVIDPRVVIRHFLQGDHLLEIVYDVHDLYNPVKKIIVQEKKRYGSEKICTNPSHTIKTEIWIK